MEGPGHTHDGREKLFSLDGHQRPAGHPLRPAKTQLDQQLQVRQVSTVINYRRLVFYCVVTLLVACLLRFSTFVFALTVTKDRQLRCPLLASPVLPVWSGRQIP